MRTVQFEDDKLTKILEERAVIFRELGEINKQLVKLDKDRTKLGYKMDRLKEKTAPIVDKYKESFQLGEFEIITNVHLNAEKYPEVEIVDMVEEYKKTIREDRKKV